MIKKYIIECDRCKKELNAVVEHFYEVDEETGYEQLCDKCYENFTKTTICKHWIELDNSRGLYEFCRKKCERCVCSGIIEQCDYPECCGEVEND